jgi:hypothetical protein
MTEDLLLVYSTIKYWRFEVIYTVGLMKSVGLVDFMINAPPSNGSCSISPLTGTTTTLFTITCSNWFDEDGIKDYLFYSKYLFSYLFNKYSFFVSAWTSDRSNRLMIGYTTLDSFEIRMPVNDLNVSLIQLMVYVRDVFDSITVLNLPSISIVPDIDSIASLMTAIKSTLATTNYSNMMTSNPLVPILYGGNQNDVCQVLTSVSQVLNILAQQNLQSAIHGESRLIPFHI